MITMPIIEKAGGSVSIETEELQAPGQSGGANGKCGEIEPAPLVNSLFAASV